MQLWHEHLLDLNRPQEQELIQSLSTLRIHIKLLITQVLVQELLIVIPVHYLLQDTQTPFGTSYIAASSDYSILSLYGSPGGNILDSGSLVLSNSPFDFMLVPSPRAAEAEDSYGIPVLDSFKDEILGLYVCYHIL